MSHRGTSGPPPATISPCLGTLPACSRPRLACIDMAGTTMRDEGVVLDAFSGALRAVGMEGDGYDRALRYAHDTMGLPKTVVFTDLLEDEDLVQKALARVRRRRPRGGPPRVGDRGWTVPARAQEALHEAGVRIAFTTGFSPEVQQAVIKQLGWQDLADLAVAPGPSLRGRPFPDMGPARGRWEPKSTMSVKWW